MKLTKTKLKRMIKEELLKEVSAEDMGAAMGGPPEFGSRYQGDTYGASQVDVRFGNIVKKYIGQMIDEAIDAGLGRAPGAGPDISIDTDEMAHRMAVALREGLHGTTKAPQGYYSPPKGKEKGLGTRAHPELGHEGGGVPPWLQEGKKK